MTATARVLVLVIAGVFVAGSVVCAAPDPLAGVVLVDVSGRPWALDDLRDGPVLLVIGDRHASTQAEEWGERLAARATGLAPWRAAGKVAWVSVADLRRVPEYAREEARARLREQSAGRRGGGSASSPVLLDWGGLLAERFHAERGAVVVVLLGPDRQPLARATGAPSETAVTPMIDAINAITRAAPP